VAPTTKPSKPASKPGPKPRPATKPTAKPEVDGGEVKPSGRKPIIVGEGGDPLDGLD
jgi:hypothetical protein